MKKTTMIVAAAGLALAAVAHADSEWAAAVNGNWGLASNWNPADVPDLTTETATIAVAGTYSVLLGTGTSTFIPVEGLVLSNPDATLDIQGGYTLSLNGGLFINNGLIRIDSNGSTADGVLLIDSNTTLNGSGIVRLNRNTDARIDSGVGATLTNNSTIDGGGLINAAMNNMGIVESNVSGAIIELQTNDKSNSGTFRSVNNGLLLIQGIEIDNTGGLIHGDESIVRFNAGTSTVLNGTLLSTGAGQVNVTGSSTLVLDGVTNDALINLEGGSTLSIAGDLPNSNLIVVDSNGSTADGILHFSQSGTVSGSGTLRLFRYPDARMTSDPGVVVTIGPDQTLDGAGLLQAAIVNNGTVESVVGGAIIDFQTEDKVNNNLVRAINSGLINLSGVTTTQSAAGILRADNGILLVNTGVTTIDGGLIEAVNGGLIRVASPADLTLDGVNLNGPMNIEGGAMVFLDTDFTNNGTVTVDSNGSTADAILTTLSDIVIDGTGSVVLNRYPDARLETTPATTLTLGSSQSLVGSGIVHAALINNGLVETSGNGVIMDFQTEPKTNNATMRATNNATLNISSVTTTQSPTATLEADGGTILVNGSGDTRLEQGQLTTANAGAVRIISSGNFEVFNVVFNGDMYIEGNATLTVDTTLTNNGTIVVDSNNSSADAFVTTIGSASIDGTGTITLARNTDARLTTPEGETMTLGAGQSVLGGGVINAAIINNGLIDSDVTGAVIQFADEDKVNNGIMRASLGTLNITGVTTDQSGGGTMEATDGGRIQVQATVAQTRVTGGSIVTTDTGHVRVVSGGAPTLEDVLFDGTMNVEGNGVVIVEGALTNNGIININSNGSSAHATIDVADGDAIGGVGVINLLRGAHDARLTSLGVSTLGNGQLVTGIGTVYGGWAWRGTLSPGFSIGTMVNEGMISMRPPANLAIELTSPINNQNDRIIGTGSFELDGALDISFLDYTPVKNHIFRILEGSSITGQFAEVNGPVLTDGLVYGIKYDPTFVEIRITCGPDLNLDGLLDFFDVLFFLDAFTNETPIGDFNEDGIYDFFDVLAFLNAFTLGCP